MNINKLQQKLHKEIPLTKLMGIDILDINNNELISKAPLDININDKGTAFGGSLSTLTTISAWSIAFLISKKFNIKNSNIVIINSNINFLRPVTKELYCKTIFPSKKEIETLEEKINEKNSGSIIINSNIIENGEICVEFTGRYVIKKL